MSIQKLYAEIEKYSQKYELSFQFWGKGNMNVFISKDGVDLTSFGGRETIKEILVDTLEWIYRVNNVPKEKQYAASKAPQSLQDQLELELNFISDIVRDEKFDLGFKTAWAILSSKTKNLQKDLDLAMAEINKLQMNQLTQ